MILLDTHVAIWFLTEDVSLGTRARAIARSALGQGRLFVSAITFWEIAFQDAFARRDRPPSSA